MNEEPEKQGFFAKRSNKILVLIIVAFIALATTTVGAMEYTSTTDFCNSCHIMNSSYGAWADSSHKGVHCYECHMDEGTINYLKAKVNGLKEVYLVVTNSATTTGTDEKAWDKCQKCHTDVLKPSQEAQGFDHSRHISTGLSCKQCHGNLVHGKENKDFKQICTDCHSSLTVTPSSHSTPEFQVTHGQAFLKDNKACTLCHSDGQKKQICQDCHGLTMPHPDNFVDKHVTEVKAAANGSSAGTAVCLKCHLEKPDNLPRKAQSCEACHGVALPHPQNFLTGHGKAVQEQGDKTCLNCHKKDGLERQATTCVSCHGLPMPHAEGYLTTHMSEAMSKGKDLCFKCHSEADFKAPTCSACHQT